MTATEAHAARLLDKFFHVPAATGDRPMMTEIARPLSQLASHYTVVVVGSGYGAVAASRLARSVCVLERGRRPPGDLPDDGRRPTTAIDSARQLGAANGLCTLDDMLAMVGCGLGGTSLINAVKQISPGCSRPRLAGAVPP